MEQESAKEDDVHNMHDEPFGESQLEVHIEPVMDEQPSLGSAIDEEQTDVQTDSRVAVFADTCPQEVLEVDRIILQEVN